MTEAQVRAARRAYYGAVSYVDDQIGALLAALAEARFADDTIVVLLADHGDMLGERGLWYKMSFFEPACRIPLIVHAPRRFARAPRGRVRFAHRHRPHPVRTRRRRSRRLRDAARRPQPRRAARRSRRER